MRYAIAIIFLSLCLHLPAQHRNEYTFRHINQSDGLLHSAVKKIVQDAKGFIWILTTNGLQRYDGSRFVNYPFDLNNPDRTADIRDISLYEDRANNMLWLMNNEMERFDLKTNKFTFYTGEKILADSNFIFDEYRDSAGRRWLSGRYGIFCYIDDVKKMMPYYLYLSASESQQILSYTDTLKGETWVADWKGLSLFDKKTKGKYTHDYNPTGQQLLQLMDKNNLTALTKDSKGNVWIGSGSQLFYRYNYVDKKLHTYSLAAIEKKLTVKKQEDYVVIVKCFFEDNHGTLWIGTANGGLLWYNRETDSFDYLLNEEANENGLHYNYEIVSVFQDKEENIWLSTDRGINIFNPYQQNFKAIRHQQDNASSLPKNEIQGYIQAANGDIICGTWGGGITVFDSSWRFKKTIKLAGKYEYNLPWAFVQNEDGNIWIGCQHGYIHVYNPTTGSFKTLAPTELHHSTIWSMTKDKAGNIWIGLNNGQVAKWDRQQNKFYPFNDTPDGISQLFTPAVNIFFDSKQRCWVSTINGFKKLDTDKLRYSAVYIPDKKNPTAISAYTCHGVEEYNDSIILIGTAYGGLNFFNTNTNTFSHTTVSDGLPSNNIHAIKKDADGFFWFTTDFDLYKFKPGSSKYTRYNMQPGIVNTEFKATSFYPLNDGRWLTSTATEIICFNPQKDNPQQRNTSLPQITGLKIFDKEQDIDSLLNTGEPIKLGYQQNFLSIEFALLNFSDQQQTEYFYQLASVDKNWVSAGKKRFASYTNLKPGEYVFSIKTETGDAPPQTTSLKIIIAAPFWNTWWFIAAIIAAILALIYIFIQWREKNIKTVEAAKLKVQELNAGQYKSKLEMEQIVNYFSSSLINKNTVDDVLWDVAKNLIGRLGFEDCMIYLWNEDKTKMVQRAGYGPKGSIEEIQKNVFEVSVGQGVVGYVMKTKEPILIPDTSKDTRYRVDEMERLSEITVPLVYDNELIGVLDSEHHKANFFTGQHVQVLSTIATLMANKIKSIESEQSLHLAKIEMLGINEKLIAAKLEALRSQMNPHFIFNCINSIDNLIQNNEKEKATLYLAKFARLIRSVLETSKSDVIPCWQDMETLKLYVELEAFRWDQQFRYKINMADNILNGDYKVPPLLIQPFVENAIHHGLLNKIDADKKLTIDITAGDNYIYYCITDNGVGRAKAGIYKELNKSSHQSMGMQITIDRINLFNQKKNGFVKITDIVNALNEPAGTKVEVKLIIN
jgi:ligand-binding sensor domain-containing protein/putative methionine-R-sulfoxide reductase with GAF domain